MAAGLRRRPGSARRFPPRARRRRSSECGLSNPGRRNTRPSPSAAGSQATGTPSRLSCSDRPRICAAACDGFSPGRPRRRADPARIRPVPDTSRRARSGRRLRRASRRATRLAPQTRPPLRRLDLAAPARERPSERADRRESCATPGVPARSPRPRRRRDRASPGPGGRRARSAGRSSWSSRGRRRGVEQTVATARQLVERRNRARDTGTNAPVAGSSRSTTKLRLPTSAAVSNSTATAPRCRRAAIEAHPRPGRLVRSGDAAARGERLRDCATRRRRRRSASCCWPSRRWSRN